eukprot:TRINITY_DN48377_c0_g1_i1.p1 TRINITY_DN48377_c0_g1~~TRINITY_DN48377_c0_g1_i1.p1  ORF type:complete len:304 (-),score=26.30 TRINITY_DN48377_c0_g1_i1:31-912(-)
MQQPHSRKAPKAQAAAPTQTQAPLVRPRSKQAQRTQMMKSMCANIICVMIGSCMVLIVQAMTGKFNTGDPAARGWNTRNITLTYFDARGSAEPIRLLLEEAEVSYTDRRLTEEEWEEQRKDRLKYPFNKLPHLQEGNNNVNQPMAIIKYLAKATQHGGWDTTSDIQAELIAQGVQDWRTNYEKMVFDKDFTEEKQATYLNTTAVKHLNQFENLLHDKSVKRHFDFFLYVFTYVDLMVWEMLDIHVGMNNETLTGFPALKKLYTNVGKRDGIKKYLNSGRRSPNANAPRSAYGQ